MAIRDDQARLDDIVRQRVQAALPQIAASLTHIANGNPLGAEPDRTRRLDRLQAKAGLSRPEAEMVARGIDAASSDEIGGRAALAAAPMGAEAIIGPTLDFVGVSFLERGRRAADAVARVAFINGRPRGTGFMVAPGLFLTNHHVIEDAASAGQYCLEFDYEFDLRNAPRPVTRFALDPSVFLTDSMEGLDFTLIGVGPTMGGPKVLESFGHIPLSDARDKHMLGEVANLVQHPDGRFKEVVVRENRLVSRDETVEVLHYIADTEPGASGAPVFNNEWEPIALHHWAGPYREQFSPDRRPLVREINEGIRISAIVRNVRARLARLTGPTAVAMGKAIAVWDSQFRLESVPAGGGGGVASVAQTGAGPNPRTNSDGSMTWTFPIEINVRSPLFSPPPAPEPVLPKAPMEPPRDIVRAEAAAAWTREDFTDRGGYEPGFIPGFVLPLPDAGKAGYRLAKNQLAGEGDDPNELRYHHFSIVLNAERRLAAFTACNIDGARIRAVDREKKTVIEDPSLRDLGVEAMGAEGAEASDDFRPDRRILTEEQMNKPFYEKQIVAGFPDPSAPGRIARMFQKGHIIMRGDPAWGLAEEALAAERDTFFYTNAAPQLGFFNQGSALDRPGSKGKLRWRAVETYVLRNAVTQRERITVFAGPIFADDDPPYRLGAKVPMRFWKIALWASEGTLHAVALLADQKPLIETMPEAFEDGSEAFSDNEELARVSEFLTTVAEVEKLTRLDFGEAVRKADIRAGSEAMSALDLKPEALSPAPGRGRKGR